ncbi:MAG: SH3 domain-containing protein [Lachnospiraceae bacterium]|nr:SH3 domain-containing protein [Lachnospiraceae bacterium]MDD3796049.1 SH3 domain-containing protein [Lachnospiraceae bacterium]
MKKLVKKMAAFLLAAAMMITCLPAMDAEAANFLNFWDGERIMVTAPDGVNMHTEHDVNASKITTLKYGSEVIILQINESNGWMLVNYNGTIGYVLGYTNGWFAAASTAAASPTVYSYSTSKQATVTASALNVHRQPVRLSSNIVDDIYRGQVVVALGYTNNGWIKVQYYRGSTRIVGYVSQSWVKISNRAASTQYEQFKNIYGYSAQVKSSLTKELNMHASPSTSARVIDGLYPGQVVTILAESQHWYKVTVNVDDNMETGYIYKSYTYKIDAMENLRLNKTSRTVKVKHKYHLLLRGTTGMRVKTTWKTSSSKIATVSKYGYVTARKKGSCKIYCTVKVGNRSRKLTCKITVKA